MIYLAWFILIVGFYGFLFVCENGDWKAALLSFFMFPLALGVLVSVIWAISYLVSYYK